MIWKTWIVHKWTNWRSGKYNSKVIYLLDVGISNALIIKVEAKWVWINSDLIGVYLYFLYSRSIRQSVMIEFSDSLYLRHLSPKSSVTSFWSYSVDSSHFSKRSMSNFVFFREIFFGRKTSETRRKANWLQWIRRCIDHSRKWFRRLYLI